MFSYTGTPTVCVQRNKRRIIARAKKGTLSLKPVAWLPVWTKQDIVRNGDMKRQLSNKVAFDTLKKQNTEIDIEINIEVDIEVNIEVNKEVDIEAFGSS